MAQLLLSKDAHGLVHFQVAFTKQDGISFIRNPEWILHNMFQVLKRLIILRALAVLPGGSSARLSCVKLNFGS
jgi:hypothetical protein